MTPLTLLLSQILGNKPAAAFLTNCWSAKIKGLQKHSFLCRSLLGFMQRQFCVNVQLTLIWKSENQSILVIKNFFTIVIILMFILCKITHLIKQYFDFTTSQDTWSQKFCSNFPHYLPYKNLMNASARIESAILTSLSQLSGRFIVKQTHSLNLCAQFYWQLLIQVKNDLLAALVYNCVHVSFPPLNVSCV